MNLEDHYLINNIMGAKTDMYSARKNIVAPLMDAKKIEYRRSLSQGHAKRRFSMSYFSSESFFLLVCLTASVLLLPLILPPLPPPPFMLLLLPLCILVVLVILAFSPSSGQNMTHPYL